MISHFWTIFCSTLRQRNLPCTECILPQIMCIFTWTKIIILICVYASNIHSSSNFNTWYIKDPPPPTAFYLTGFKLTDSTIYYRNTVFPYSDFDKWWCMTQCDGEECSVLPCSGFFRLRRSTNNCLAAGAWAGQANMDTWCQNNCAIGYCPSSHCVCHGKHVCQCLLKMSQWIPVDTFSQINIHKYISFADVKPDTTTTSTTTTQATTTKQITTTATTTSTTTASTGYTTTHAHSTATTSSQDGNSMIHVHVSSIYTNCTTDKNIYVPFLSCRCSWATRESEFFLPRTIGTQHRLMKRVICDCRQYF